MQNSLLTSSYLPEFEKIKVEEIYPAITHLLNKHKEVVHEVLSKGQFSFETLVLPLELLNTEFEETWGIIHHLSSVKDSTELRVEYEKLLPLVTEYFADLGQNEDLYQAYLHVEGSPEFLNLNYAQQKLVHNAIRDFKLAGVGLSFEDRHKFKQLEIEMNDLENQFSKNVLDATESWTYFILESDKPRLSGIPEHTLQEAKELAGKKAQKNTSKEAKNEAGYLFTLEYPCVDAILSYADDRELRKIIYTANSTIASDQPPHQAKWDNSSLMLSILHKREAQAKLLGFHNFAEYSLATKMVKDPHEVIKFLRDLLKQVKPKAEEQYADVKNFAKQKYNLDEIFAWDLRYLNEKLKMQKFDYSEEELRTYFPESQVLNGLFSIVQKLYGVHVKEITYFQKWHDSVRLFEVLDSNDNKQGMFYLDLYVRPNKRQGAWCGDCRSRHYDSKNGEMPNVSHHKIKHPVAYVVANFGNPAANQEAQFTHDEVITMFHEFGHCLHHILTKVDFPSISGTQGVEWDAVELPSQFLENWCYEKESLDMVAKNKITGKPLPDELFYKVKAAENFQGGLALVRQLEFALFDMLLHSEPDVEDVQMVLDNVRKEVSVIPVPSFNRFQNSFSHIFAGGYAAGYYSYLWSEMLSADAFSLFKEQGIFNRATGENFLKNILEMGGSKDAMTLFKAFRGRAPEIDALLKQRELMS